MEISKKIKEFNTILFVQLQAVFEKGYIVSIRKNEQNYFLDITKELNFRKHSSRIVFSLMRMINLNDVLLEKDIKHQIKKSIMDLEINLKPE